MAALACLSLLASGVVAAPSPKTRGDDTAVIHLGTSRGTPQHLASGFIYGIPDQPGQIPSHFYTDLDINSCRTGGAQWIAPRRGWLYGEEEYAGRFRSSLSNYEECRQYGAQVSWLPHDLWGTDGVDDDTVWPGDGGQWDDYDKFVHRALEDLYKHDALDGSVWEVWNEPDLKWFWLGEGGMQQWIDLYIRTHKMIRADSRFDGLLIAGPSLANRPREDNEWWTEWLRQIAEADTIPDQYTYHLEGDLDAVDNDPTYTSKTLSSLLDKYDLPSRQVNVNEYAQFPEQVPSGYAWYISGLERFDFIGLLGNWQPGSVLHDLFANLITKRANPRDYTATDYAPAPGYWVYEYYARQMTGHRVQVDRSGDGVLDVYATVGDRVRLLAGTKVKEGNWHITLDSLESLDLPSSGTLSIDTWSFDGADVFAVQAAPSFRNSTKYDYTDGSLTFPVYQTDNHTAWAFEFDY